jgi:hypothetical protein
MTANPDETDLAAASRMADEREAVSEESLAFSFVDES